jgi:hypothetical protein
MKTLRRFWDWNRHEKPTAVLAGAMLQKNLSPQATLAIGEAQRLIAQIALPRAKDWPALLPTLERLSLAVCEAIAETEEITKTRAV